MISDVKDYLLANQMLRDDGTVILTDVAKDVEIAQVVNKSLLAHGVTEPDQIGKAIQALPLFLSIFGVNQWNERDVWP